MLSVWSHYLEIIFFFPLEIILMQWEEEWYKYEEYNTKT